MKACSVFLALVLTASLAVGDEPAVDQTKLPPPAAGSVDFDRDIRPILVARCYACHGADLRESGLRLDRKVDALAGGDRGLVLIAGRSAESRLVHYVAGLVEGMQMPPDEEQLGEQEIALLRAWIDAGLEWPDDPAAPRETSGHWAYQPPLRPPLPAVSDASWPRAGLDYFVLARLDQEGLRPSPAASREVWLRRVSLDLIGLPPTLDELEAFLSDESSQAYERAVDRLLASPHYGERWARPWLDLARYADTQGYEKDNRRVIWPYRDWVIDAFNGDLPFDEFTIEQLAGDMIPDATDAQRVATGFHRNTMCNTEGGTDNEEFRTAAVVDRVNTTFQVWLGTTLGCCQCHSHKYDPFTQREYFQVFAFFNGTADADTDDDAPRLNTPTREEQQALSAHDAEVAEFEARLQATPAELTGGAEAAAVPDGVRAIAAKPVGERSADERAELARYNAEHDPVLADVAKQLEKLRKNRPGVTSTPVMQELPEVRETRVHMRGNFLDPGEVVTAEVPAVLPPLAEGMPRNRLGFAQWLVDPGNPLVGRVLVNRLWEQYFGRGIVETCEDFGTQGDPPTHPELLDWLATELVRLDWSLKALHREIVLSATYRQSSRVTPDLAARDPQNRLMARGPRLRLEAEMVRDQALAIGGLLSAKLHGPSVMPPQPEGIWQVVYSGDSWQTSGGEDRYRRGLYTFWRRTSPHPMMTTFDAPSREVCVVRRSRSNTPLQALVTLNDPQFVEAAQGLARRMMLAGGASASERIAYGFRLCTSRRPETDEAARLVALFEAELAGFRQDPASARQLATEPLGAAPAGLDVAELAAWTVVANVLLNLDETLTRG